MVPTEAYAEWRDVIEASPDIMYEEILQRFRGGRDVLAADYLKASRDLEVFRRKYFNKTSEFNAIICQLVLFCRRIWKDLRQIIAATFHKT